MTHKELHEGTGGSGKTVYLVVTIESESGRWLWTERFTSKSEADSWMRWS